MVNITESLVPISEISSIYAYNTNVDYIPNLNSKEFILEFATGNQTCYFKKKNNSNLLLLCSATEEGEIYLGKIEEEIILNDIHYKYNFLIQPVDNNKVINIKEIGSYVALVYPGTLDFTSQNNLIIRYIMSSPLNEKEIKLNPDSSDYL